MNGKLLTTALLTTILIATAAIVTATWNLNILFNSKSWIHAGKLRTSPRHIYKSSSKMIVPLEFHHSHESSTSIALV